MDPGRLRHEITIEAHGTANDGAGNWTETWDDRGTVWAEIKPLTGRELYAAQAVSPQTTHRVTMRYWPGLTAEHRLKFGSRIFHLEGPPVNPGETNDLWVCACREEPSA
jgi:SPP1 family predicted phage head-tail adaptor